MRLLLLLASGREGKGRSERCKTMGLPPGPPAPVEPSIHFRGSSTTARHYASLAWNTALRSMSERAKSASPAQPFQQVRWLRPARPGACAASERRTLGRTTSAEDGDLREVGGRGGEGPAGDRGGGASGEHRLGRVRVWEDGRGGGSRRRARRRTKRAAVGRLDPAGVGDPALRCLPRMHATCESRLSSGGPCYSKH